MKLNCRYYFVIDAILCTNEEEHTNNNLLLDYLVECAISSKGIDRIFSRKTKEYVFFINSSIFYHGGISKFILNSTI